MNNKTLILSIATMFLFACNDPAKDTSYYLNNIDEAKAVVEKCGKGDMTGDDCKNAREATSKNTSDEEMKKMLGL